MGCDIHLAIEVKINGRWQHYGMPRVEGNYRLFSLMCGVRYEQGQPDPVVNVLLNDVPEDADELTKFHYNWWRGDAHHLCVFSWAKISELIQKGQKYLGWRSMFPLTDEMELGYCFGNSWENWKQHAGLRGVEDVRWVVWFDN